MGLFLFISIFIIMKLLIKKLLRENIQLADKLYFNQNKLSPQARELILRITNGDPYTKLITDMYYYQLFKVIKWIVLLWLVLTQIIKKVKLLNLIF
jgi:hypothetical protein